MNRARRESTLEDKLSRILEHEGDESRVGQHSAGYKSLSSVKRHFAQGNQPGMGLDPSRARKVSEWGTRGRGY